MGIKTLALLALLIGVLYCLHLLVQDYQAITAAPRLLKFLFKRDTSMQNMTNYYSSGEMRKRWTDNVEKCITPNVRWKRILFYDPLKCVQYLFCDLGATPADNKLRRGFIYMLSLEPHEEDKYSHEVFKKAYNQGRLSSEGEQCGQKYPTCPFSASILFELIQYLLRHDLKTES